MPTIVKRVSNTCVQGTRWRATPNAHQRKDQTVKISENKEERTRHGWLIFSAVNWLSFIALQTPSASAEHARLSARSLPCCLLPYDHEGLTAQDRLQSGNGERHKLVGDPDTGLLISDLLPYRRDGTTVSR
jgi:hypothetical protein